MFFRLINKQLIISILNKNNGKFRFKERSNNKSFGISFPTLEKKFNQKIYLEWQISYDTTILDIKKNKKRTILRKSSFKFKGANGKEKYPYELSEFLYSLINAKILKKNILRKLRIEIERYEKFLIETIPKIEHKSTESKINNLQFKSTITKLPTYYYFNKDKTYIETVVQKQQYALGFQPMVYFCIPINCFSNKDQILGWTSKEKEIDLKYCVNETNSDNILFLFKVLAMSSPNHKQDVMKILNVLERGV